MHTPRLPPSRQSVHGPRAYTARKVQFDANVNFLPSRRPASLPDSRTVHPRKHPRLYVHLPVTPAMTTRSHNRYGALDSGTTKHMIPEGYTGTDPRPITYGPCPEISCPNGSVMSSPAFLRRPGNALPSGICNCPLSLSSSYAATASQYSSRDTRYESAMTKADSFCRAHAALKEKTSTWYPCTTTAGA